MEEYLEILEFLYYSIIFFITTLFFAILIDIVISRLFPQGEHNLILLEIFLIWICLSILLFYSKKLIYSLPNPFTKSKLFDDNLNIMMIITLVPLIVSISVSNMKYKTNLIHKKIEEIIF